MIIYHIVLKRIDVAEKFDAKLLILACLRISAVIHDIEYKQDDYTQIYYRHVKQENKQRAELEAEEIIQKNREDSAENKELRYPEFKGKADNAVKKILVDRV